MSRDVCNIFNYFLLLHHLAIKSYVNLIFDYFLVQRHLCSIYESYDFKLLKLIRYYKSKLYLLEFMIQLIKIFDKN